MFWGWYRRFIPRSASIAKPMYNLLEDDKAFRWPHECEIAFSTLKEMLISNTVLSHPHPDRTYVLTTDAFMVEIGAELAQQTPEGIRPVAYFSKTLSKSERKYSVYDKEFLAIVMAVHHFRHHLIGTKFCLRTDHHPLQFLANTKDPWGKRARWIMELEEYSFTVEYISSQENVVANALSRLEHEKTLKLDESEEIGQNNNRANPIAAF